MAEGLVYVADFGCGCEFMGAEGEFDGGCPAGLVDVPAGLVDGLSLVVVCEGVVDVCFAVWVVVGEVVGGGEFVDVEVLGVVVDCEQAAGHVGGACAGFVCEDVAFGEGV